MSVYRDGFESWKDVASNFSADIPEPDEVLFAEYDLSQAYEGSADVIYRSGDKYYWASGSHCSCYGLEGQWDPVEYDAASTLAVALERHYQSEKWAPLIARLRA